MNNIIKKLNEINKLNDSEINSKLEVKELKEKSFKSKVKNIEIIKNILVVTKQNYDLNTITNEILKYKLNVEVKTIEEAIKKINEINLFKTIGLKEDVKEIMNIPFKFIKYQVIANKIEEVKDKLKIENTDNVVIKQCIEDNTIYSIYKIKDCYYRVIYSKRRREYYIAIYSNKEDEDNYDKYYFSDIFQILFCNNYKECIANLVKLLNITITNTKDFIGLCDINITYLEDNINKYKYLQKLISKYIPLLKEIYDTGISDYYFKKDFKNNYEIFFSIRYFAQLHGKSKSTITPYLNGFSFLGFYKKRCVNDDSSNGNCLKNESLIYEILPITEKVLIQADEIAKVLLANKITMSKINRKNISKLFNEDIANKIFLGSKSKGGDGNE